MKIEALTKYKEKIKLYNEKEQELRKLYLKDVADGKIMGCLTGYPSLDQIWLQWYEKENLKQSIENEQENKITIFEYFLKETQNFPNAILLEYYGRTYTRDEIKDEVMKTMQRLEKMGLQKGDTISLLMLNTPEAVFLWYAALQMGITANLIKFDESSERIKSMTEQTNSKCMFITAVPETLAKVKEAFQENKSLEQVIVANVNESLSAEQTMEMIAEDVRIEREIKQQKGIRLETAFKQLSKKIEELQQGQVTMDELIQNTEGFETWKSWEQNPTKIQNTVSSSEKGKGIIVYTGGSTGAPKGVQLSDMKLNCVADVWKYGNHGMDFGDKSLNILPPAIAYYFQATHASLCRGVQVSLISHFTPEEYPYLVKKYRPNIQFGGPILYENIRKANILEDTSFMKLNISGGDKMQDEEEEKDNQYLQEHGGKTTILQGYGMSEGGACTSVSKPSCYKVGSIGIPFINQTVGIFNYRTDEELSYNAIGEICVTGPTLMEGYFNDPEETDYVLIRHNDGQLWLHTDDLGFVDEEGRLYHRGRAKRMLTRSGAKLWLSEIERIAVMHPEIEKCCAVKISDEIEREVPVLHFVLTENATKSIEEITAELSEMIERFLGVGYIPKYYITRQELPYSEVNKKCDFKKLEQEDLWNENDYTVNSNIIYKRYGRKKERTMD